MQIIGMICPKTIQEALLNKSQETTLQPIAGGTDLLVLMHKETHLEQLKSAPAPDKNLKLLDISSIEELKNIIKINDTIEIGACATHAEISENKLIQQYFPMLANAAGQIGSPQIRNRGTIGGNIAHASPSADTVPPLMVLNAELELSCAKTNRRMLITDFFLGPGQTSIGQNEIITKIILPLPTEMPHQSYKRLAARSVHACAKVSVAFAACKNDGRLIKVKIAFGAVAPTVILGEKTAKLLEGKTLSPALISAACDQAANEVSPINDIRSTGKYRRAMVGELLRRELEEILNDK